MLPKRRSDSVTGLAISSMMLSGVKRARTIGLISIGLV